MDVLGVFGSKPTISVKAVLLYYFFDATISGEIKSVTRGYIEPISILTTNRKLHTCFQLVYRNQRPWVTLNSHCALCFKIQASFGAHHKNLIAASARSLRDIAALYFVTFLC